VNATKLLNKTGTLKSSNSSSDLNVSSSENGTPLTVDILPTNSTPKPLSQEDVDKSMEDGKNIIKD